ncbi:GNAT family N-acetyltransferase [Streptosporangium sp. NPDC020072]|uniref:GNAT family N-acetyltransferase n=1 Tax=Streptosporangium sp. NPDC020072 TaxID=3154788 RepID=UPI00343E048A
MDGERPVRELQERAARALPVEHVRPLGEWSLRHTRGPSWWAGTVLPHGDPGPGDLTRGIVEAEAFYAGHRTRSRFQISPACPGDLDPLLAERGYLRVNAVSLQAAPTTRVLERLGDAPLRIRLDERPTAEWFRTWQAVNGRGGSRAEWDMLTRLDLPCAYACAVTGGGVVAVGRAVADTGWTGVFGMATLPGARGRGAARGVLAALARWAAERGTARMYLQVEPGNAPALRLYGRAGFEEVCAYHYRVARREKASGVSDPVAEKL